jgi:hypothetical protein
MRSNLPVSLALAALAAIGVALPSGAAGQDAPPPASEPAPPPATDGKEPAPADPAKPDEPDPGKPGKPGKPPRPGKDDDGDMGPKPGKRELDTESPAAKALDELLNVDPRFAKDGTVELIYTFKDETEVGDFTAENLDRAEEAGKRGRRLRGLPGEALSVGAGPTPGVLLHKLPLRDDYEAIFRCHIERTSTRSDLVFLAGKGGSAWGTCLVLRGSSGFAPLGEPAIDKDPWNGGRLVTVRIAVKGGELTTQVNGATRGAKKVAGDKLDGKVGLFLSEMHLIVHRVTIRGKVDATKM